MTHEKLSQARLRIVNDPLRGVKDRTVWRHVRQLGQRGMPAFAAVVGDRLERLGRPTVTRIFKGWTRASQRTPLIGIRARPPIRTEVAPFEAELADAVAEEHHATWRDSQRFELHPPMPLLLAEESRQEWSEQSSGSNGHSRLSPRHFRSTW